MNAWQKIIFIIVTLYYLFINFFYAFINFFDVRNKFNNYLHFTSFEKLRRKKYSLGISNEISLKNTDFFRTRGNPDLVYKKMNYLYTMDKDLHSTWPWLSNYLETYQFNTFDDTFLKKQRTNKWRNKVLDISEQWAFKVDGRYKDIESRSIKALNRRSPLKGSRWFNPNHERFVYNYKWSDFKDLDYNEALFIQLEGIDRNRRRLELLLDQDVGEIEATPLKDLKTPLIVEGSLVEFPKTKKGKFCSPLVMSTDLTGFHNPMRFWPLFDWGREQTLTDELIIEKKDRYNDYLFERDRIIKRNEKLNSQNIKLESKNDKKYNPKKEIYYNTAYLQAKKRSEFFQKIFKNIIYCKPEREWPNYYYIGEAVEPLEPDWVFNTPKVEERYQASKHWYNYLHIYPSKKTFGKRKKWLWKKKYYKRLYRKISFWNGRPIHRSRRRYRIGRRIIPLWLARSRAKKAFLHHKHCPRSKNWRYLPFKDLTLKSKVSELNNPKSEFNLSRFKKKKASFDTKLILELSRKYKIPTVLPIDVMGETPPIPEDLQNYNQNSIKSLKKGIRKMRWLQKMFIAAKRNRPALKKGLKYTFLYFKKEHEKKYLKYLRKRIWIKRYNEINHAYWNYFQKKWIFSYYERELKQIHAGNKWSSYNKYSHSTRWPHLINTFDEDFYLYDDIDDILHFYKNHSDLKEFFVDRKRRYFAGDWGRKKYKQTRKSYWDKRLRNPKRIPNFEEDPRSYHKTFDTLYTDFNVEYIPSNSPVFVKNTKLNKLWKEFKINQKPFINENFIDLKLKNQKNKTYKTINYYNKLLYAKYTRTKKYNKKLKNNITYPTNLNLGKRSAFKHLRMIWDDILHKDWEFFTKLTLNNINIPLIHYKWSYKIYRALEIGLDFKPYRNIMSYLYDSPIISTYFNWLIKVCLKVLNNRLVVWFWNKLVDLTDINYSKRYNKYLEKLAFNKTYTLDEKIKSFFFKFIVKSFIAIITFLTFLYNMVICSIQNFFLLNFSTIIDWLSYFN